MNVIWKCQNLNIKKRSCKTGQKENKTLKNRLIFFRSRLPLRLLRLSEKGISGKQSWKLKRLEECTTSRIFLLEKKIYCRFNYLVDNLFNLKSDVEKTSL